MKLTKGQRVVLQVATDLGDEIKGWREVPRWGEDQYTAAQLEAHAAEQVRVRDAIIADIEKRFPNWRSYRDLIDCIDCTLHDSRGQK